MDWASRSPNIGEIPARFLRCCYLVLAANVTARERWIQSAVEKRVMS